MRLFDIITKYHPGHIAIKVNYRSSSAHLHEEVLLNNQAMKQEPYEKTII